MRSGFGKIKSECLCHKMAHGEREMGQTAIVDETEETRGDDSVRYLTEKRGKRMTSPGRRAGKGNKM